MTLEYLFPILGSQLKIQVMQGLAVAIDLELSFIFQNIFCIHIIINAV